MIKKSLIYIVVFLSFFSASYAGAQEQPLCAGHPAIDGMLETVAMQEGIIEPIKLEEGIAIYVTARKPESKKAIQAAREMFLLGRNPLSKDLSIPCGALIRTIREGKILEHIEKTSSGILLVYTSKQDALVTILHKNLCSYCSCSRAPAASCKSCCE